MENLILKGTYTQDEKNELDLEMHCELNGEVFEHEYKYNSYFTTKQFYNCEGDEVVYIYKKYLHNDMQVYDIYFKQEENLEMLKELKEEFEAIDNFIEGKYTDAEKYIDDEIEVG